MTCHELSILIHHYCCPGAFSPASDLYNNICKQFLSDEMFKTSAQPNGYEVTDKGKAWLACILETPPPTRAWLDADGKIITSE